MLRSMKRFSAPASVHPDPTRPPDDDSDASLSDGSKKVKTTQSFEPLFNSESLSDIVLDVNRGEAVFHAHKTIVGLKSERLAALITSLATTPSDNSSKPVLHLQEAPECSAVFSRFLYFIYSGAVWLHRDYVVPLFKLSVKYGVNALANHCENYILQLLNKCMAVDINCANPPPTLSVTTVCDLYEESVYREETRRMAFNVLARRFVDLIHTERWITCEWLTVRDLLRCDECLCEENLILVAATDWMKRNKLQDKGRIQEILSSIRYPRLPRRVLYHLYTAASFKNFPQVQDLIEAAIRYHCFKDVPEAQDEFTGLQYRARGKGRTRHTVCGGENLNSQELQHQAHSWQWEEASPDINYNSGQCCDSIADFSRSDEVNDNHSHQHTLLCRAQRQTNHRPMASPVAAVLPRVHSSDREICSNTTDIALQINIHSHSQM
ncbi:BTB/POZ domain-containing protein 17 [Biomphalaria pfeifferi]|uniref:BTB/POZ domain-containing protein 17 n=1 Tax=Biomphalaria pfeifferi TaxID=112525 RepID=A0AAD8B711_BIOPF|nr:BTB/POZ domain-containing protein 17 [Biomphalaria pfeifferi]